MGSYFFRFIFTLFGGNFLLLLIETKSDQFAPQSKLSDAGCKFTEHCMVDGVIQYHCIAKLCQITPLDCLPGHIQIGSECMPFAVTGGECKHPAQCLTGSVCIRGKCQGPCDENQLFIDNNCTDYEGAGCISRTCVENKCPQAFPSCNYVPQKDEYLCCERQIRSTAKCPNSNQVPQISRLTNDAVNCLLEPCGPGFTCQFTNSGSGRYICCSVPTGPINNKRIQQGKGTLQLQKRVEKRRRSNLHSSLIFGI